MATFAGIAPVERARFAGSLKAEPAVDVLDRLIGLPLLIGAAPIIAAAAIVTACLSRRPPFIAHLRTGRYGEPFWMLKIRTMWDDEDPAPTAARLVERIGARPFEPKTAADPRVRSRFARICRKYSIDELPQLLHVVTGEMSIVGPRPVTESELEMYYGASAHEVLQMRPGLSGLWQVMGRNRLSYRQRRRLDLFFVRHFSAGLYLRTLLRTIPNAVTGRNAW